MKNAVKVSLYKSIREVIEKARTNAYRAVNFAMVEAYWNIGRLIVEDEQKGNKKAEYALRSELSWTHYRQIMRVESSKAREWYMNEAAEAGWSTRQLERQINTSGHRPNGYVCSDV